MDRDPLDRFTQLLQESVVPTDGRHELKQLLSSAIHDRDYGVYVEDCYRTLVRLIDDLDEQPSALQRQTVLNGVDALRDEMRLDAIERGGEVTSIGPAPAEAETDPLSSSASAIAKR